MTLCKALKFCEICNLAYGSFDGKQIIPIRDELTTKKAPERGNRTYHRKIHCCVIWKAKKSSLIEAVEDVRE